MLVLVVFVLVLMVLVLVTVGQRPTEWEGRGAVKETGFNITAASKIMAALVLMTLLRHLRERMGRMVRYYCLCFFVLRGGGRVSFRFWGEGLVL